MTSASECPPSRGSPSKQPPPRRRGGVSPRGCTSKPRPKRSSATETCSKRGGHPQIRGRRDLQVRRFPRNCEDPETSSLHEDRVVRSGESVKSGRSICGLECIPAKGLRGLGQREPLPR